MVERKGQNAFWFFCRRQRRVCCNSWPKGSEFHGYGPAAKEIFVSCIETVSTVSIEWQLWWVWKAIKKWNNFSGGLSHQLLCKSLKGLSNKQNIVLIGEGLWLSGRGHALHAEVQDSISASPGGAEKVLCLKPRRAMSKLTGIVVWLTRRQHLQGGQFTHRALYNVIKHEEIKYVVIKCVCGIVPTGMQNFSLDWRCSWI